MNPARRMLPLVLLVASLPLLSACQRAQEAAVEAALKRATGTELDVKDGGKQVTIKTKEGDLKISADPAGNVALPPDLPADIYLPRKHRVNSVMDMAGMQMVNLVTRAGVSALSADVERHMQAGGWKREMAMQADGSSTLMYSKDKRQVVYQLVKAEDGETQLAIRTGESS